MGVYNHNIQLTSKARNGGEWVRLNESNHTWHNHSITIVVEYYMTDDSKTS